MAPALKEEERPARTDATGLWDRGTPTMAGRGLISKASPFMTHCSMSCTSVLRKRRRKYQDQGLAMAYWGIPRTRYGRRHRPMNSATAGAGMAADKARDRTKAHAYAMHLLESAHLSADPLLVDETASSLPRNTWYRAFGSGR
jgi:hypothetical protein